MSSTRARPGVSYGDGIRYELTIGSVRFYVPGQAVLDAFEDGRPYYGHYVGRGVMNTLLSAESTDGRSDRSFAYLMR